MVEFKDEEKLMRGIVALRAFAAEKFEKVLHLKLIFAKEIDCNSVIRPFQLNLPSKI